MNTPVTIRTLDAADGTALRQMLALFGTAFDDPESYTSKQPSDGYLAGLLARDTFIAVAAFADARVVGGLAGYVLQKFEQERSEFYIYDLAVAESFRRQGVATLLIRTLQARARERGIGGIFVQADIGDDPAIALYARLGQGEDVIHFDIPPLDGSGVT